MATRPSPDRLRAFIDLIVGSLDDDDLDGAAIAGRAFVSRYHFDRLVAAALQESPGAFRRRLLLERAAWRVSHDAASVTETAVEAGYGSVEGFGRAFARAYGAAPSRYRTTGRTFRLATRNGVHFHPPGGLRLRGRSKGARSTTSRNDSCGT